MRLLYLTNNDNTRQLYNWLTAREDITRSDRPLTKAPKVDCIISYNYRHIIPAAIIHAMPKRIINLHIGYLPFCRGASPLFWGVCEAEPIGVTIHYIDEGIDTGEILVRHKVELAKDFTMQHAYDYLHIYIQTLFRTYWHLIRETIGTHRTKKDFENVRQILEPEGWDITIEELNKRYRAYREVEKIKTQAGWQ